MPVDNTVLERAAQFNEVMAAADVQSFWRPAPGNYADFLIAVHVTSQDFNWNAADGLDGGTVDGIGISFEYLHTNDPNYPEGRPWRGELVIIPTDPTYDPSKVPPKRLQALKYASDRLITNLTIVSGQDVEDAMATAIALAEDVENLAAAGSPMQVSVSVTNRKNDKDLFNNERIRKVLVAE